MSSRIQRQSEFSEKLNQFLTHARDKAVSQFEYNEATNIPKRIIEPQESVKFGLQHGVAVGWNQLNGWCCEAAFDLAYAILEDANCHTEAAALKDAHDKFNAAHA